MRNETVSVDPETGVKKRTVVTERVVTTKTFHAIPIDGDHGGLDQTTSTTVAQSPNPESHMSRSVIRRVAEPTYTNGEMSTKVPTTTTATRIVQLNQNPFHDINFDHVANLVIVTRVKPVSCAARVCIFLFTKFSVDSNH